MSRYRAFTLIELLAVIGITAILAAILFPLFSRAQRTARRTQCVNNMHQISLAVQAYAQDWEERFPMAYSLDSVWRYHRRPALKETMAAYITDDKLWRCPDDTGETFPRGPFGFRTKTPPINSDTMGLQSYSWPGLGPPYDGNAPKSLSGILVTSVRRPATTTLIWDTRPWHGDYRPDEDYFKSPALYNVLYCDGHIAREPQAVWCKNQMTAFR